MKEFIFGMFTMFILVLGLFLYLHRVGRTPRHRSAEPTGLYRTWRERSRGIAANPEPGGPEAEAMVEGVRRAFAPFTVENIRKNFPEAYAEEMYFRDAFHTYTTRSEMVDYMVKSAEMNPGVTFEFSPHARDGIDFYLPWVMVVPGGEGKPEQRSLGVSHLRFDAGGRAVFHQDYWDSADFLVPKVPVANGIIELVRRRF